MTLFIATVEHYNDRLYSNHRHINMIRFHQSIFSLLLLLPGLQAIASDSIRISEAWIAEAPPVSKVHAGYFKLSNAQATAVRLTGVSSKAYGQIELHRSLEQDGVASMQRQDSVTVDAGSSLRFEPGGYHLMMFNPDRRYQAGDSVELTFAFDSGQQLTLQAAVKKHGAVASQEHEHHHHHHH